MRTQATVGLVLLQVAIAALHLVTGLRTGWLVAVYAPTVPHRWPMALLDTLVPFLAVFAVTALACPRAGFARQVEAALWARATVLPLLVLVALLRPLVVDGLPIDPDRFPNLLRLDQATVCTWLAIAAAGLGIAWMFGQEAGSGLSLTGTLVALAVPLAAALNFTMLQHNFSERCHTTFRATRGEWTRPKLCTEFH